MTQTDAPRETAYYYPEPYWLAQEGGWIKSLLLFFDEVAILLPSYMRGRNVLADPTLAAPLADEGLLRVLEPESFLDMAGAEQLVEVVTALVTDGAFDELSDAAALAEISMSRMGYGVLDEVSHALYEVLADRELATRTGPSSTRHKATFTRASHSRTRPPRSPPFRRQVPESGQAGLTPSSPRASHSLASAWSCTTRAGSRLSRLVRVGTRTSIDWWRRSSR